MRQCWNGARTTRCCVSHLGNLLYKQKNCEKAALHLSRAVEMGPRLLRRLENIRPDAGRRRETSRSSRSVQTGHSSRRKARRRPGGKGDECLSKPAWKENYPQMTQINADEFMCFSFFGYILKPANIISFSDFFDKTPKSRMARSVCTISAA